MLFQHAVFGACNVHMPLCVCCHAHMPLIEFVHVNMQYYTCYFNMPFLVRENRAWCVVACDVASDKLSVTNTATVCGGQAMHVTIYCHYDNKSVLELSA
jgi:hypothetical protein